MDLAELNTWMADNNLRGYWTTPRQEGARALRALGLYQETPA